MPNLLPKTLHDDAVFVYSRLTQFVEQEHKDVTLVLQSYSGVVGTEVVTGVFSKSRGEKTPAAFRS